MVNSVYAGSALTAVMFEGMPVSRSTATGFAGLSSSLLSAGKGSNTCACRGQSPLGAEDNTTTRPLSARESLGPIRSGGVPNEPPHFTRAAARRV